MALTENERELLAVVKYYNAHKPQVARLVNKLTRGFDMESVASLTGFTPDEIGDFIDAYFEKKNAVKKPGPIKKQTEENEGDKFDLSEEQVEESTHKPKPIVLTSDSSLAERVAYEMSMQIGAKFKSGDKFYGQKAAMAEFQCTAATVTEAFKFLLERNLIEQAEPGNFRKGYVVK